jgi:hypothetical protein
MLRHAREIRRSQESRQKDRSTTYQSFLTQIARRIEETSKGSRRRGSSNPDNWVIYTVPDFVPGKPIFDMNECVSWLTSELTKNGYIVRLLKRNVLMIEWDMPAASSGASASAAASGYRPVGAYRPTVYTDALLQRMESRFHSHGGGVAR